MMPENAVAAAVAMAAPLTPQPAPHMVKLAPNTVMVRLGKMSRKFKHTLIRLVAMLKMRGVRVSPAQRNRLEQTLIHRVNMYTELTMAR